MNLNIRPVLKADLPQLKEVIKTSELFPADLLDDMISDYFEHENSEAIWLTVDDNDKETSAIAVAYCAPEPMTEGTYNLYLLAVHQTYQSKGIGRAVMSHLERDLSAAGHRILLVETSGLPDFERTRKFYRTCNYEQVATIKEFYSAGEDKIVFWKKL